MATKSEIKNKRVEVKEMIKTRLREDPDIGPHELIQIKVYTIILQNYHVKRLQRLLKVQEQGIGVATTVNTIAPGLFSTAAGYLAGSGIVSTSWLVNAGLITTGIFAPTTVNGRP